MTKQEANRIALQLWGWTGRAFRIKSHVRDARFLVGFIRDDGEEAASLVIAGTGGSYEEAFKVASTDVEALKQQAVINEQINSVINPQEVKES